MSLGEVIPEAKCLEAQLCSCDSNDCCKKGVKL